MRALLINGSPAEISRSRAILDYLSELFISSQVDNEIVDLKSALLPINDPVIHADAMQSPDENVRNFAQKVKDAEIIVLSTPLYHGSFSGLLKLALDNLDGDAFAGKTILICSNASGPRNAMQAAQELVVVGRTMSGKVHERIIGTNKADYEEKENKTILIDTSLKKRCQVIVNQLTEK